MKRLRKQTLDGNVETLLLGILQSGPNYGYAIVEELNEKGAGLLRLGEGTIYPVLYRLEEKGLILAKWRKAESGRDRKYYRLSAKGRRALEKNRGELQSLTEIMETILGPIGVARKPKMKGGGMMPLAVFAC